jgi:hypothetical protein
MKHIAKINIEFLKIARKWDDLSYDEQSGYLKRHPKTKRRITARPDNSTQKLETYMERATRHLKELDAGGANIDLSNANAIQNWMIQTKENFSPTEIARDFPSFTAYNPTLIATAYKNQHMTPAQTSIPTSMPATNLAPKPEPQFPAYYYPAIEDEKAKSIPTIQTHLKELYTQAERTDLTNPQEIKDWIEKTKGQHWAKSIYPHIDEYNPEQIATAYKEQKAKTKAWPEQNIVDSFKSSLKRLFSSSETYDEDPVRVNKTKDGMIRSVEMDFRYLGDWINRRGEEDDDHPTWSRESAKKYTNMFKDWAKSQPWFDKNTMDTYTRGSEKAWVEFGVERKQPESTQDTSVQSATISTISDKQLAQLKLNVKNDLDKLYDKLQLAGRFGSDGFDLKMQDGSITVNIPYLSTSKNEIFLTKMSDESKEVILKHLKKLGIQKKKSDFKFERKAPGFFSASTYSLKD